MKRFVGLTLAFSGAIFGLFVVNLILYSYNPQYHEALEAAVAGDSHIPVVTADGTCTSNVQMASDVDKSRTDNIQMASGVDGSKTDNIQMASGVDGSKTDNIQVVAGEEEIQADRSLIDIPEQDENAGFPLSASYEKEAKSEETPAKPSVVNKEYHEDCGTGEGYWIIQYSDGSVEVE